jgi:hypothetical protein
MILAFSWSVSSFAVDCRLVSSQCVDISPVKSITGMDVPLSAAGGCWEYEDTYECLSQDSIVGPYCEELRTRGCTQTGSRCIDSFDSACTTFEQTYECPSEDSPAEQTALDCGGQLVCLEGDCFDASYEPNNSMGRVGALFSAMETLSEELEADRTEVFRGKDRRCGVSAVGARNCCRLTGWAEDEFNCSMEEELLLDLRNAQRCHAVGRYCSDETVLGICLEHEHTYCCFGSKLSRILAEQGHRQLNKTWGQPRNPDCSGFTLEEVSQLDFEAMDLSEFYSDVIASMPTVSPSDIQQRMSDRIEQLNQ